MKIKFVINGENDDVAFLSSVAPQVAKMLPNDSKYKYLINVTMISDDEMIEMNKQFRKKDRTTDIITFAFEDIGEKEIIIKKDGRRTHLLADIYINKEQINRQKKGSYQGELVYMLIHGLLHSIGYDHQDDEQEKEMNNIQDKIFKEVFYE